jgi:hypothetical protein
MSLLYSSSGILTSYSCPSLKSSLKAEGQGKRKYFAFQRHKRLVHLLWVRFAKDKHGLIQHSETFALLMT